MVPILNAMSIVGVVSIPGMMTGQLLGGSPPELAARYQILIMFLIASATGLGAATSTLLAARACFDEAHRVRPGAVVSEVRGRGPRRPCHPRGPRPEVAAAQARRR